MSTSPRTSCDAGQCASENTTHSILNICCANRKSYRRPLNSEKYNGYSATASRSLSLPSCTYNNDDYDEAGDITCQKGPTLTDTFINSENTQTIANRNNMEAGADCADSFAYRYQSHSRLGHLTRQTILSSSLIGDSMTEIVIDDLQNAEDEPTSAILAYCKKKFVQPYVAILALIGINPLTTDTTTCRTCLNYFHVLVFLIVLCFGYILQYFCAYRVARGFFSNHKVENVLLANNQTQLVRTVGEIIFDYIIPSTLHLLGYISAIIVCKIVDQEQLLNLIERVFLMSMKPRRLCCILWSFITFALLVLALFGAYTVATILMQQEILENNQVTTKLKEWHMSSKILLMISLFLQQLVQIIILCSYCIECYLLRTHLLTLSYKLLMHSINYLDWMREILEFHKLLDRLNERVASPVCFFIMLNLSSAFAASVHLFNNFNLHYSELNVNIANLGNIFMLLLLGLVPFFMASSLTRTCQRAKENGHQIRVRPFVYHNSSVDDLNSTLLFASSLEMSAKLFCMPIQRNYLCFGILIISMSIITVGMCFNITALGF